MNVLSQLASSHQRNDEALNISLAEKIAENNNKIAVKELITLLDHMSKNIRNDVIKVLYETGERNPALIAPYFEKLISLLKHKDQRMQWGAMCALDAIALSIPEKTFQSPDKILAAMAGESVIARDHGVKILCKLSTFKKHSGQTIPLLLEQIRTSPVNQLPMYAEHAMEVIPINAKTDLLSAIKLRWKDVGDFPAKQKRLEKVIRKLQK